MNEREIRKIVLEGVNQVNGLQGGDKTITALSRKGVLNTADIRTLFSICERTVERWRKKRKLKYIKPGRYYYLWHDVLPLLISEFHIDY